MARIKMTHHIALLTVLSFAMTYLLYAYKPRNYSSADLVLNFVYNMTVWVIVFGVPDLLIVCLVRWIRREKLFRIKANQVK
jgi:hypothetical protein